MKSMRSSCDFAVTETFIACVMRGDCVKLKPGGPACFTTCPWHRLVAGDVILYPESEVALDGRGRWLQFEHASALLEAHRVQQVVRQELDKGFLAASIVLARLGGGGGGREEASAPEGLTVRTLYKDQTYCMNHMFSSEHGVLRDLLTCRASEFIASKMGAGFFLWSALIKSAKNKHFSQQTLERFKVSNASVKTTYVEIVRTWLQKITGLSVKPVQCNEFYKCNPCEAAFYRYPLNLQATSGCTTSMFGGSLTCLGAKTTARGTADNCAAPDADDRGVSAELIPQLYQPLNMCFSNARVLMAHKADRELINRSGKLVAHCIVDYYLPRYMHSSGTNATKSLEDCKRHLLVSFAASRERLCRATAAFNAIMNNCLEHMVPACRPGELQGLIARRQTVPRLSGEKLDLCRKVVEGDMSLAPAEVYRSLSGELGQALADLMRTWIETFKRMRWLKSARAETGRKRTARQSALGTVREVTYHCAGCKNFYRDLCANKVYGSDNKRRLGRCVNEAWWLV